MSYHGKFNSVQIYIRGLSERGMNLDEPPMETYQDVLNWFSSFDNVEIPRSTALKLLAHLLADRELGA